MGEKQERPKKKLTQKQLDALAKGRAKSAEKRRQKKLDSELEQEAIKQMKTQKAIAKDKLKEQNALEKIRIRQRAEERRNKIFEREEKWKKARVVALEKCKNEDQFNKVSQILDKIQFQDFETDDGIKNRLQKYM